VCCCRVGPEPSWTAGEGGGGEGARKHDIEERESGVRGRGAHRLLSCWKLRQCDDGFVVVLSGDTDVYGGPSLPVWGGDWGRYILEGDFCK